MTDRLAWLPLRRRSIAVRLAVSSFLSSTAILVIAAFILTTLYRENTERAFDSRLLVFANNLATDLVSPSEPETRSFSLGETRSVARLLAKTSSRLSKARSVFSR